MRGTTSAKCPHCFRSPCECPDPAPTCPATPVPSENTQDTLVDGLAVLNIRRRPVTEADVLGSNEVTQGWRPPSEPNHLGGRDFYLVSNGRSTGVLCSWEVTGPEVIGHPCSVYKRHKTYLGTFNEWDRICVQGKVQGPLHPESIFPLIISRSEVSHRIAMEEARRDAEEEARRDAEEEARWEAEEEWRRERRWASAAAPVHHADSTARAGPSSAISSRNSTANFSTTYAASPPAVLHDATVASGVPDVASTDISATEVVPSPAASRAASSNPQSNRIPFPVATTSVSIANLSSDRSSSVAAHSRGCEIDSSNTDNSLIKGKGKSDRGDLSLSSLPPPAAWVVLRGVHPGVYTDREEYLLARGSHRRVWVIPCASYEEAERIFAYRAGFMEFLEDE